LGPRCILTNFALDVAETFDDREKIWFGKMKEKAANLKGLSYETDFENVEKN
jgi:hypothetical protein